MTAAMQAIIIANPDNLAKAFSGLMTGAYAPDRTRNIVPEDDGEPRSQSKNEAATIATVITSTNDPAPWNPG
jgi:hypothetical protein